jgi:hypothetical protein
MVQPRISSSHNVITHGVPIPSQSHWDGWERTRLPQPNLAVALSLPLRCVFLVVILSAAKNPAFRPNQNKTPRAKPPIPLQPSQRHQGFVQAPAEYSHSKPVQRSSPRYALPAKIAILRSARRLLPALAAILIPASVLSKKSAMLSRSASKLTSPCSFALASTRIRV